MATAPGPDADGPGGAPRPVRRRLTATALDICRTHGWRVVLVFAGLLLPMWGFAELADEVWEREPLPFDEPLLRTAREIASPGMDRFFVIVTNLGYRQGLVPMDVILVLLLAMLRHYRAAVFAALSLGGAALLNIGTKLLFARDRPALWESIQPEQSFSFPSGHAMGTAALAWVLVLLAWRTRWRWPVVVLVVPAVVLVGFSRVYLGVHFPSDILAGWAAASIWVAAIYLLLYRFDRQPWGGDTAAAPPD